MSDECNCGFGGDFEACINGTVYGPCSHESCSGVCSNYGECTHDCHKEQPRPQKFANDEDLRNHVRRLYPQYNLWPTVSADTPV